MEETTPADCPSPATPAPPTPPVTPQKKQRTWQVWSALNALTILGANVFSCGLGCTALYFSSKAKKSYEGNDVKAGESAASIALILNICATVLFSITTLFIAAAILIPTFFSMTSSANHNQAAASAEGVGRDAEAIAFADTSNGVTPDAANYVNRAAHEASATATRVGDSRSWNVTSSSGTACLTITPQDYQGMQSIAVAPHTC